MGYSELLLKNDPTLITVLEAADEIFNAGKQARDLITHILTFSRKMDPVFEPVDLNEVISDVKKMLDRTMSKMVKITYCLSEDTALINADTGNIVQVLMNLCANAQDAMPDGGQTVIKTEKIFPDRDFLSRHTGVKPGYYFVLSVTDTGTGMAPSILDYIWDPFFTSKDVGKGTGLGLSSVYGIVQSHDGHIICASELCKGTTFKIYFPALETSCSPVENASEIELVDNSIVRGETILLVDDEKLVRDIGKRILRLSGYNILEATSGEEALEIYRERGNLINLVILDISMPGMGGEKCLKELLVLNPEIKVIQASGYFKNGIDSDSSDHIAAYLQKPFTITKMTQTIRQVLDL